MAKTDRENTMSPTLMIYKPPPPVHVGYKWVDAVLVLHVQPTLLQLEQRFVIAVPAYTETCSTSSIAPLV